MRLAVKPAGSLRYKTTNYGGREGMPPPAHWPPYQAERLGVADQDGALRCLLTMHPIEGAIPQHGLAMATLEL